VQVRVAAHVGEGDKLQRILSRDRGRNFREIAARAIWGGGGGDADCVISRNVQRIVWGEGETLRCDFDSGAATESDQTGFVSAGGEFQCPVPGIQDDAAVVQMADRRLTGGQGAGASLAFVGCAKDAGFGGNWFAL
jgi:hypothetical protein